MPSGYMQRDEFALFYNSYFNCVRRAAGFILGDERDSLAVVDITMCYAFCHPDKFRKLTRAATETYLLKIARTRSYDELRCRFRHRYTDISEIENTPYEAGDESIERLVEIRDFRDAVKRCVLSMPDIYREALTMKLAGGMTINEIAMSLGIPFETAKTRCRRGMALLKGVILAGGYGSL